MYSFVGRSQTKIKGRNLFGQWDGRSHSAWAKLLHKCFVIVMTISLVACAGGTGTAGGTGGTVETPVSPSPPPTSVNAPVSPSPAATAVGALTSEVAQRLQAFVAEKAGVEVAQVQVVRHEAQDWNNSCLGATGPGEFCAQVITPGYRVVMGTPKGEYVVHCDRAARSIRLVRSP